MLCTLLSVDWNTYPQFLINFLHIESLWKTLFINFLTPNFVFLPISPPRNRIFTVLLKQNLIHTYIVTKLQTLSCLKYLVDEESSITFYLMMRNSKVAWFFIQRFLLIHKLIELHNLKRIWLLLTVILDISVSWIL